MWSLPHGSSSGRGNCQERSDIKVVKINVDEEQELAMQFGVMSIPTLVVMKNGKVVNQATGARPKAQILAML